VSTLPLNTPFYGGFQSPNPVTATQGYGLPPAHVSGNEYIVGRSQYLNLSTGEYYILTGKAAGGVATWALLGGPAGYPITPYVVGPIGQAGYQTIQSAINAANDAGGGIIYIQPGIYTENLNIPGNITLIAAPGELGTVTAPEEIVSVKVIGTLTINTVSSPISTFNTFANIYFAPAIGDVFTYLTNDSAFSTAVFIGCILSVSQLGKAVIACDGFPTIDFTNCVLEESAVGVGNLLSLPGDAKFCTINARNTVFEVNETVPCEIQDGSFFHFYLNNCNYSSMISLAQPGSLSLFSFEANSTQFSWSGSSNNPLINFGAQPGSIELNNCVYSQGSGGFSSSTSVSSDSYFEINNTYFDDTITLTYNCVDNYNNCIFFTDSDPAIIMNSTGGVSLNNCVINSSNNPAIAGSGSGTLSLGTITFVKNDIIANTLTLNWLSTTLGKLNLPTGTNNVAGTTTLVLGTSTVSNTSVTASSLIFATHGSPHSSTAVGVLNVIPSSSSFTVNALNSTGAVETGDLSDVFYFIVNPA
jgi:hypothetical protein